MSTKPLCFVIMPYGKSGTQEFEDYRTVYEIIIKKPILDAGFECKRGDEIPDYGPIPEQIKKMLMEADLVVADLSGRNPNVFYELGFRHALGSPSISISNDLDGLPFDVATYRTILYRVDNLKKADDCSRVIREYASQIRESIERKRNEPLKPGEQENTESLAARLETNLSVGLSNIYQVISELSPKLTAQTELYTRIDDLQRNIHDQENLLSSIQRGLSRVTDVQKFTAQSLEMGLVGIYSNRLDAIEMEFYDLMKEENLEISIVGYTMFGLRGKERVNLEKILNLLQQKTSQPTFRLRILLTHWDFISSRQLQERTDKNVARFVISKELKEAVGLLRKKNLSQYVKFYKGSPTCSTIVCEEQKRMLVNPYPYESEAINSWTAIFREGNIYTHFKTSHVDRPWENPKLAVAFSSELEEEVKKRLRMDLELARDDMSQELDMAQKA
jgi:hypothetical protein